MCTKRMIQGAAFFAAVFTTVTACNTPSTPLQPTSTVKPGDVTFEAAGAQVRLLSADRDKMTASVHATLEVEDVDGHWTSHRLELQGNQPRDQQIGAVARLLDPWGETEFEVGVAWTPEESTAQFWERTQTDDLDFIIQKKSEQVVEIYRLNGEVQTIQYPASTSKAADRALYRVSTAGGSASLTQEQALAQFQELYRKQRTLDHNRHGELLVAIVTHPQFTDWLEGYLYPDGRDGYATIDRDKLCVIASACAAAKCLVGGMANPLCTACGGVSIACVIADLALWAVGEE